MAEKPPKFPPWASIGLQFVTDVRVILTAAGIAAGGTGMKVWGDAGVTRRESTSIADSVVDKKLAPFTATQKRQDTALMRIFFRQDVQMNDVQKARADSLMQAALKNINYGGSP